MRITKILMMMLVITLIPTCALALRKVDAANYKAPSDMMDDIEPGTTVTFEGYMYSCQPYQDEDTFCMCLIPFYGLKNVSPMIYCSEEELQGIVATPQEPCYVRVTAVVENEYQRDPNMNIFYAYVLDGKGSIEVIDKEAFNPQRYDLNELTITQQKLVENLRAHIDTIVATNAVVVDTEMKQEYKGSTMYSFSTTFTANGYSLKYSYTGTAEDKLYFVGDCVNIQSYIQNGSSSSIILAYPTITFIQE